MDKENFDNHKTFFPFILVGLSVLLAVGFYAMYSSRISGPPPFEGGDRGGSEPVLTSAPAPTHDQYVASVSRIIADYRTDQSADQTAYDRLVAVTVPQADLATHLELVIIFGKFLAGETVIAESRYQSLKQTVSWLP